MHDTRRATRRTNRKLAFTTRVAQQLQDDVRQNKDCSPTTTCTTATSNSERQHTHNTKVTFHLVCLDAPQGYGDDVSAGIGRQSLDQRRLSRSGRTVKQQPQLVRVSPHFVLTYKRIGGIGGVGGEGGGVLFGALFVRVM